MTTDKDDPADRTTQPNGLAPPQTISAIWLKEELAERTVERDKARAEAIKWKTICFRVRDSLRDIHEQLGKIIDDG